MDNLSLYIEYHLWAHKKVFRQLADLSPEEWSRDTGGSFPSLRALYQHLLEADYRWLQRSVLSPEQRRIERARAYTAVARELGAEPAPLAIAWCLRNPHVSSVILGATRPEQLRQNLQALELVDRYAEPDWDRVEKATA